MIQPNLLYPNPIQMWLQWNYKVYFKKIIIKYFLKYNKYIINQLIMINNANILFIGIFLFEFIVDVFFTEETIKCINSKKSLDDKIELYSIIYFHHMLSVFIIFGWMLTNIKLLILYIFMTIGTIISWSFNNGLCYITVMENVRCHWVKTKPFNHVFSIFNIPINKKTNKYFIGYTIFGLLVALYKIIY